MENERLRALESRVESLEKTLQRIERALDDQSRREQNEAKQRLAELTGSRARKRQDPLSTALSSAGKALERLRNSEGWIGKIGIALLLLGLVFLFKYAVDQGWLTPSVRIGFGLLLGLGLLGLSARLYEQRRHFSLLLFGGGVVAFYVTGFAAFQVFGIVPYAAVMAFMIAVTALSFLVSVRQSEAFPSLLGTVGGLATPFLLYSDPGSVPGLVAYTCVLVAGALLVYFRCGWRPLLWLTFVGGWLVLAAASATGFAFEDNPIASDRLPMQAGIVFSWLLFAVLPLARETAVLRPRSNLHPTVPGVRLRDVSDRLTRYLRQHLMLFTPVVPFAAVVLSLPVHDWNEASWGWILMGVALIYAAVAYVIRDRGTLAAFSPAHGLTAILAFTSAVALLLEDNVLLVVLAVEAAALLHLGSRFRYVSLRTAGHVLFSLLAFALLNRLAATRDPGYPVFNPTAGADLLLLALGIFGSWRLPSKLHCNIYRVAAHVAMLAWFARELHALSYGQALVTICWGLLALTLVVAGLRLDRRLPRTIGLATLILVVGKLIAIDLAAVDMIWRIALFMGFGGVFLALSYYFRVLWRRDDS